MCWELDDYEAWQAYMRKRHTKQAVASSVRKPEETPSEEPKEVLHAFVGAAAE